MWGSATIATINGKVAWMGSNIQALLGRRASWPRVDCKTSPKSKLPLQFNHRIDKQTILTWFWRYGSSSWPRKSTRFSGLRGICLLSLSLFVFVKTKHYTSNNSVKYTMQAKILVLVFIFKRFFLLRISLNTQTQSHSLFLVFDFLWISRFKPGWRWEDWVNYCIIYLFSFLFTQTYVAWEDCVKEFIVLLCIFFLFFCCCFPEFVVVVGWLSIYFG